MIKYYEAIGDNGIMEYMEYIHIMVYGGTEKERTKDERSEKKCMV
jgi:hypothetical protein